MRPLLRRRLTTLIVAAGLLAGAVAGGFWFIGWWLDYSEEPRPSDLMVVLCGWTFSRPHYAADLFHRGLAPEIWVGMPRHGATVELLHELKIPFPREHELVREVLLRRRVPPGRIHHFGDGILSTYDEALALARAAPTAGKNILVVTSRTHARRAGIIFRRALPRSEIRVVASPREAFSRRWWATPAMAYAGVLETSKTLYYFVGGRFLSEPTPAPEAPKDAPQAQAGSLPEQLRRLQEAAQALAYRRRRRS